MKTMLTCRAIGPQELWYNIYGQRTSKLENKAYSPIGSKVQTTQ